MNCNKYSDVYYITKHFTGLFSFRPNIFLAETLKRRLAQIYADYFI